MNKTLGDIVLEKAEAGASLSSDIIKSLKEIDQPIDDILKKSNKAIDINKVISSNHDTAKSFTEEIRRRNENLANKILFINNDLSNLVTVTKDNLYLIGARSGHGKSTVTANIIYPLWITKKRVVVISTEETASDVYERLACLHLGLDFNENRRSIVADEITAQMEPLIEDMSKYLTIVDVNNNNATTHVDKMIYFLEDVKKQDFDVMLIDYFQLISNSDDRNKSDYNNLDRFGEYLKVYFRQVNFPIFVAVQLHSTEKKNENFQDRIKECTSVYDHCTVAIEIKPDFKNHSSTFTLHKGRFGNTGKWVTCGFEKGRYVNYTQEFKDRILRYRIDDLKQP